MIRFINERFATTVRRLTTARDDEVAPLLWATAYGFCILFSYYIMRAVRDEISSADRGNLQILWTAVFFAMLVAVPAYAWAASRFQRGVLIPLANRFFIANLVGFYLALVLLPARQEGFGIAAAEALACGVPVVATPSGGPEQLLRDSGGGVVVPGWDAAGFAAAAVALLERVGLGENCFVLFASVGMVIVEGAGRAQMAADLAQGAEEFLGIADSGEGDHLAPRELARLGSGHEIGPQNRHGRRDAGGRGRAGLPPPGPPVGAAAAPA